MASVRSGTSAYQQVRALHLAGDPPAPRPTPTEYQNGTGKSGRIAGVRAPSEHTEIHTVAGSDDGWRALADAASRPRMNRPPTTRVDSTAMTATRRPYRAAGREDTGCGDVPTARSPSPSPPPPGPAPPRHPYRLGPRPPARNGCTSSSATPASSSRPTYGCPTSPPTSCPRVQAATRTLARRLRLHPRARRDLRRNRPVHRSELPRRQLDPRRTLGNHPPPGPGRCWPRRRRCHRPGLCLCSLAKPQHPDETWSFSTGGWVDSRDEDGGLYAVDAATGEQRWTFTVGLTHPVVGSVGSLRQWSMGWCTSAARMSGGLYAMDAASAESCTSTNMQLDLHGWGFGKSSAGSRSYAVLNNDLTAC
jgi:PQQ enzyme repeat